MKHLFTALVLLSASAFAADKTLYIRSKDTKLFSKSDLKGAPVATLQPGDAVVWKGADPKNKVAHKVVTKANKEGFTVQANLTTQKPTGETLKADDGKAIDAQAFASSGAATKALSDAGLKYADKKKGQKGLEELTKGLMTAEGVAASVKDKDVNAVATRMGGAK